MKKKNLKKKGFTLIELIVVIAILGILAAILVPRLGGFSDKAKTNSDTATSKTITTAVTSLIADGTWTVSGAGSVVVTNNCASVTGTNVSSSGTMTTELSKLIGTKFEAQTGAKTGFTVTVDANGNCTTVPTP